MMQMVNNSKTNLNSFMLTHPLLSHLVKIQISKYGAFLVVHINKEDNACGNNVI